MELYDGTGKVAFEHRIDHPIKIHDASYRLYGDHIRQPMVAGRFSGMAHAMDTRSNATPPLISAMLPGF